MTNHVNNTKQNRGGSRISGKGVQMYNGVCGGSLCCFDLIFLNIP